MDRGRKAMPVANKITYGAEVRTPDVDQRRQHRVALQHAAAPIAPSPRNDTRCAVLPVASPSQVAKQHDAHRERIRSIKPSIDNAPPTTLGLPHMACNLKRMQVMEGACVVAQWRVVRRGAVDARSQPRVFPHPIGPPQTGTRRSSTRTACCSRACRRF